MNPVSDKTRWLFALALVAALLPATGRAAEKPPAADGPPAVPSSFGFGRIATQAEIDRWNISIRPDGKGLPAGSGDVATGRTLYATKCAGCHGGTVATPPGTRLPGPALFNRPGGGSGGGRGRTVGNYWPYATTLFDYVRRAMPLNAPGTLTNEEVYALNAYVLFENQVIEAETVLNAVTLPKIRMPAQPLFVPDDRKGGPEVK